MSWPCQTTCLCTTIPNTGAELEDWTLRKARRLTWNTVLKSRTKHQALSLSKLSLSSLLSFFSTPLPSLPFHPLPPVWLRAQPLFCLCSIPLKPALSLSFLSFPLLPPGFSLSSLVVFLTRTKRGESGS